MESIKELRHKLQTNVLGHPILQRVLSIYITRALLPTSVTATQVTVAMVLVGVFGAIAIAGGWVWTGFALIYLCVVLDATDGEVARYRRVSSLRSIYMDLINHLATQSLMILAVSIVVARTLEEPWQSIVLIAGALNALAVPLRRANGELHQTIYIRPYSDPGLFRLDRSPAHHDTSVVQGSVGVARHALRFIKRWVHEAHHLAPMLVVFVVAYAAQLLLYPDANDNPILMWVLLTFAVTNNLYLIKEVYEEFHAVDQRVFSLERRMDTIRAAKERYE